ncbi:MAG: nucleoside monophosphate kinase, partial [Candidatus Bathyarchaeota archaeon]
QIIGKIYDLPIIAAGDMLREAASKDTVNGKIAKRKMNKGELVPDEIVIEIMEERLSKPDVKNGFVLDGFPRSLRQAIALDRILKGQGTDIDFVLTVTARPETIVNRLSLRRICHDCGAVYHLKDKPPEEKGICDECGGELIQRQDDKEEIIKHRFEVYEMKTFPIIERYASAGKLREISGELEISKIQDAIEDILGYP